MYVAFDHSRIVFIAPIRYFFSGLPKPTMVHNGEEEKSGRHIPENLKALLEWDRRITKIAFDSFDKNFGYQQYHSEMKCLEISCHGIPWLVGSIAMLYFGSWPGELMMWMNLLVYLVIDIVFVALLKVR